jgi:hypothetical protein
LVVTPPTTQQCSIALWRGFVSGQFYVRWKDREGALSLSPTFRLLRLPWEAGNSLQTNPTVLDALAGLNAELLSKGWERMRRAPGSEWYELRFRRATPTEDESQASPTHLRALEAPVGPEPDSRA